MELTVEIINGEPKLGYWREGISSWSMKNDGTTEWLVKAPEVFVVPTEDLTYRRKENGDWESYPTYHGVIA